MQDHPDAKGLYGTKFPYYDTLSAIYRNDIATGEGVEDISEAVGNMEEELAAMAEPPILQDPHAPVTVQRPLTTMHMFLVT